MRQLILFCIFNSFLLALNQYFNKIFILDDPQYHDHLSSLNVNIGDLLNIIENYSFGTGFIIIFLSKWIFSIIIASIIYLGLYLNKVDSRFLLLVLICFSSLVVFNFQFLLNLYMYRSGIFNINDYLEFTGFSLYDLIHDIPFFKELIIFKYLNIFEFLHWLVLGSLLAKYLRVSLDSMLKIVLGYYVSFLFCWIVFVMFISLGNS